MSNEIVTLQFGHYSNFIGAHWWNIQEASFVYKSDSIPEINYDVLFREGENIRKEVTYTPRLLLTDLKGSSGSLPLHSDLYDEVTVPDVSDDTVLWPAEKTQVEYETKNEKNAFLADLENRNNKMNVDETPSLKDLTNQYDLDDEVRVWSDYLGTKFHPKTVTIVNEFTHESCESSFNTFSQGVDLWRTDLFTEEWTDRCRAYVEECDYLQGFQILFDCVDGFSGLSFSALTYLQDEYSSKSVFGFPSMTSAYSEDKSNQHSLRIVNSVLSLSELPELCSAFVPLCTDVNGWDETGTPRTFQHLHYNNKLPYHSSALLAAFLDSISMTYRLRKNITRLSSLLSKMSPCGRKLLIGTVRLPFPVYPGLSILESLEELERPFWTSLTPKTDVTADSAPLQELYARGLSSFSLLPSLEKRKFNPAYECQSVDQLLAMYFDFCAVTSQKTMTNVKSFNMPLKIPVSFPNIFDDTVTRIGCISSDPSPLKFAVVEAPILAGLHNCSSASLLLTHLHEKASKINFRTLHQFSATGFEHLEYSESMEKLLTLNDNYT